jgi:serine/threonine-protein kinase
VLGTRLGNYTVTAKIGEGGMGTVYLAEHAMLGRRAAIKVLLPQLSNHRDTVARFFNEARAATAIRHPSIVEIFDFGYLPAGSAYLAMEFLDGESLAARRGRLGRFEPARAMALVRQIAGALAAAHERGIIHRDLKPDNVFVVADPEVPGGERIKILDFGIAKLASGPADSSRTQTGTVLGTPTYIAPEQCRGAGEVDARADLYALGCVFYELVCGRPPFVIDGSGEMIAHHLYFEPEPPRGHEPSIPEGIERLILWLLRKQPDARPQSARELIEAIDRLGSVPDAVARASQPPQPPIAAAWFASVPAQPTTLSAATGVAAPRAARPRRWLIPAVATATASAGIAIVVAVTGGTADRASPAPAAALAPAPVIAQPAKPVEPAYVQLTLDSEPRGADVLVDGVRIGATPLDDRVAAGAATRVYAIVLEGYEPSVVTLGTARDSGQRVALKKKTAPPPAPPPQPPTAPPPSLGDRGINPFDH